MIGAFLMLLFGTLCCATALILIRLSSVHPVLLAGLRCLIAAAALLPWFLASCRRHGFPRDIGSRTLLPGLFLAGHFITWIFGARMALGANASLIVNLVPLFMPLMLWIVLRERPITAEWLATGLAVSGVLVLTAGNLRADPRHVMGDLLCFISMLFLTYYLVLARRNRDIPLWLYVVPLYLIAGGITTLASLPLPGALAAWERLDVLWVLALGIVPTVIGHSILNHAMARLPGQTVAVVNLMQFILAGLLVWLIFKETPRPLPFSAATLLIVAAVVITFRARSRTRP